MVPVSLQMIVIIGILFYFAVIFYLLKKKTLALKYTLMWILAGIFMAIIAVFPTLLKKLSILIGIETPSNALFAVLLFVILLILMSLTSIISGLNKMNVKLIQAVALLEKRVRDLEKIQTEIENVKTPKFLASRSKVSDSVKGHNLRKYK